jgi:tRNA threonylcarbamoyl adenosine modification protein (Sua5/YciO/YrdC/YwlC family)
VTAVTPTLGRAGAHPRGGDDDLREAIAALRAGAIVAIPTDTVYGLAVDPSHPRATKALFSLKRRPQDVDLPVLVAGIDQAARLVEPPGLSPPAQRLATAFWPGPLTIVVPRRKDLHWALGPRSTTIGLRCPQNSAAQRLCELVGPLAVTSANLHGEPPCTDAPAVKALFASVVVVDGGESCGGTPSTVVDVTGSNVRCLREGALPWRQIATVGVDT